MTEEAKRDWLAVAWATLKHLPVDLLRIGAAKARETADHPAKVVPIIVRETAQLLESRRRSARESSALRLAPPIVKRSVMDRRGEPMNEDETNELNGILANLGATARYRPDGSRYQVQAP
jgi:hypothetical protein